MKKIIVLLMCLFFVSCVISSDEKTEETEEKIESVNVVDQTSTNAIKVIKVNGNDTRWTYEIIEFEEHRYMSTYQGGIIHLESCPCKN